MFKKTLTAAVAALATMQAAQAGGLGKLVAAALVGSAISNNARAEAQGYRTEYRPVRGGYEGGCSFHSSPIFDEDGNRIGSRRVPAC